ncbi:MAG: acyl-CoA dehydrogenase family protein [Acidimicrobiales bacterium]
MDFALPAELIEFQELIREVAVGQVGPRAEEVDKTGEYPQDYFEVFREVGLLGLCLPAEHGGSGAGLLGLWLALEELSKVSVAAAVVLELARTSAGPIMIAGTAQQRERYLPGIADGSQRAAIGLAEREAGDDVSCITTAAVPEPDGWRLSGTKCSVLGAAQADWFVVFAKTDDPASRARDSVTAFVVEAGAQGVALGSVEPREGVRGVATVELALDGVLVPADCVIGAVGGGMRLAMLGANLGGPLAAARAVGLAEGALMCATEALQTTALQTTALQTTALQTTALQTTADDGLRREVARVAVDIEAVRLLSQRAAWMIDVGQNDRQWSAQLSLANRAAAELAVRATGLAAQVLGASPEGAPVGRWSRDAHQLGAEAGSQDACLERIAAGVIAHELWWGGLDLDL